MMRIKQLVMLCSALGVVLVVYVSFRGSSQTPRHSSISLSQKVQGFSLKTSVVNEDKKIDNILVEKGPVSEKKDSENEVKKTVDVKPIVNQTNADDDVVAKAKKVSEFNGTVLVTMINDAYLSFTYSWLCNTKEMNVHKSVLIITADKKSKESLQRDWPEITVVAMELPNAGGDQIYSHVGYVKIMIRRTEMLDALVQAGIEIFIFEVDCLWFTNPITELQRITGVDILVNPVAARTNTYAGGFLYLYKTEKARKLWRELTRQMTELGKRISKFTDNKYISEADNDQMYLSALVTKK